MIHHSFRPDRPGAATTGAATDRRPIAEGRIYDLGIWSLALGYALFYAPYSALVKATSKGLLPGLSVPPSPLDMLPAIGFATAAVTTLVVTSLGWWRYCGRTTVGTWRLPRPLRCTVVGGLATAAIIYTTTLMFTFAGVSIVLALLIMRGGVLVLAPVVDLLFGRRVRWFAGTGLVLSLGAVAMNAIGPVGRELDWVLAVTAGTYLLGYVVRLRCANVLAKSHDREPSYRYFVEEQLVAMTTLVALPLLLALMGDTTIAHHMRQGLSTFLVTAAVWPALGIGALYGLLYCCGTLIYLDRRENTFCVTLNRCASLLAGVLGSFALTALVGERPPGGYELLGAALILVAILVLSPVHHALETLTAWRRGHRPLVAAPAAPAPLERKGEWP
ncbi:MAG TPA: hypothetical protein VHI99_00895 [Vicinamibacterales bacterium]|jgi:hypothetical protein|nr:hypothetical protein [Vicinamibacterales bacterium]